MVLKRAKVSREGEGLWGIRNKLMQRKLSVRKKSPKFPENDFKTKGRNFAGQGGGSLRRNRGVGPGAGKKNQQGRGIGTNIKSSLKKKTRVKTGWGPSRGSSVTYRLLVDRGREGREGKRVCGEAWTKEGSTVHYENGMEKFGGKSEKTKKRKGEEDRERKHRPSLRLWAQVEKKKSGILRLVARGTSYNSHENQEKRR